MQVAFKPIFENICREGEWFCNRCKMQLRSPDRPLSGCVLCSQSTPGVFRRLCKESAEVFRMRVRTIELRARAQMKASLGSVASTDASATAEASNVAAAALALTGTSGVASDVPTEAEKTDVTDAAAADVAEKDGDEGSDGASPAEGSGTGAASSTGAAPTQKAPSKSSYWAHLECVLWTPECYFDPSGFIAGAEWIPSARMGLNCEHCGLRSGASKVLCAMDGCNRVSHVSCAKSNESRWALCFREQLTGSDGIYFDAYCVAHAYAAPPLYWSILAQRCAGRSAEKQARLKSLESAGKVVENRIRLLEKREREALESSPGATMKVQLPNALSGDSTAQAALVEHSVERPRSQRKRDGAPVVEVKLEEGELSLRKPRARVKVSDPRLNGTDMPPLSIAWQHVIPEILDEMMQLPAAAWFNEAVDWKALGLKDYRKVVKRPMDFGTIARRLNEDTERLRAAEEPAELHYPSLYMLTLDVDQVFINCSLYNGHDHDCDVMNCMRSLTEWWNVRCEKEFGFDCSWRRAAMRFLTHPALSASEADPRLVEFARVSAVRIEAPYLLQETQGLKEAREHCFLNKERVSMRSLQELRLKCVKTVLLIEGKDVADRKLKRRLEVLWRATGCAAVSRRCLFGTPYVQVEKDWIVAGIRPPAAAEASSITNLPAAKFEPHAGKEGVDVSRDIGAAIKAVTESEARAGLVRDLDFLRPSSRLEISDWQARVGRVLAKVEALPDAEPFKEPVKGVAGYSSVVKKPMDLGTIRERLSSQSYVDRTEVARDFRLMITNCKLFNGANPLASWVTASAFEVEKCFQREWIAEQLEPDLVRSEYIDGKLKEVSTSTDGARLGRLGRLSLGAKIELYKPNDKKYVKSELVAYDEWFGLHHVRFADGFVQPVRLVDERVRVASVPKFVRDTCDALVAHEALAKLRSDHSGKEAVAARETSSGALLSSKRKRDVNGGERATDEAVRSPERAAEFSANVEKPKSRLIMKNGTADETVNHSEEPPLLLDAAAGSQANDADATPRRIKVILKKPGQAASLVPHESGEAPVQFNAPVEQAGAQSKAAALRQQFRLRASLNDEAERNTASSSAKLDTTSTANPKRKRVEFEEPSPAEAPHGRPDINNSLSVSAPDSASAAIAELDSAKAAHESATSMLVSSPAEGAMRSRRHPVPAPASAPNSLSARGTPRRSPGFLHREQGSESLTAAPGAVDLGTVPSKREAEKAEAKQVEVAAERAPAMTAHDLKLLRQSEYKLLLRMGVESLGLPVEIYWRLDKRWYPGIITHCNQRRGTIKVSYEDGDELPLDSAEEPIRRRKFDE